MNPPQSRYIDRAELAQILCISRDMVRKNEHRWSFDRYKVTFNRNTVRYHRAKIWAMLVARGWVE